MVRGERPIKLGDSWFSAKTIEVVRWMFTVGGRALNGLGGFPLTKPNQTPNLAISQLGSQTARAKLRGLKENSPDRQLRSPNPS